MKHLEEYMLAALATVLVCLSACPGKKVHAEVMTQEELWLSRMIVSEAGYHPGREAYAILHVLEWRRTHLPALRGLTLEQVGHAYCSEFNGRSRTRRAAASRSLAPERVPPAVLASVRAFLRSPGDRVPASPCVGAVHWAGRGVRNSEAWRRLRVDCSVPVQNDYFSGEP